MQDKVRQFIIENFLFDAGNEALGDDDSFLDLGIIDSTGILEVVNWIQEEFGIEVDDTELVPENLDSVNSLSTFIQRKTG